MSKENHVHKFNKLTTPEVIVNGKLRYFWRWGCKCGATQDRDLITEEEAERRVNEIRQSIATSDTDESSNES